MKHIMLFLLIPLLSLMVSSCEDDVTPTPTATCPELILTTDQTTGDPYTLRNITIEEDCLNLVVRYSGGCAEHDFELRWSENYGETDPLTALLVFWHDGKGDQCEASVTDSLQFDLIGVQIEGQNTIQVQVSGSGETPLTYEY